VFVDEAYLEVKAGDGGDGVVSFRREKYVPRGGPDGGDGGHGGSVIVVAGPHMRTLVDFTYRSHFAAARGGHGQGGRRHGKNGAEVEIKLPVGTVIRNADTGKLIADLVQAEQRVILARGGRGGRGNAHFATSTRQTPRFSEKGEPGEQLRVKLELKLLADVGVIGLPNVGKSSLIAQASAARPKIADYPFTTLIPNLGVVRVEEGRSFVIADLPGLVEGAHHGAGRGHAFLRHVERTRVLIHVLNVGDVETDPPRDFEVINRELELHDPALATRPQLVALNKLDLNPPEEKVAEVEAHLQERGYRAFRLSALTGEGVFPLMAQAAELLESLPVEPVAVEPVSEVTEREAPLQVVRLDERTFQVSGTQVERMVRMTDLDNEEAVRFLHRRLERLGVIRQLRSLGAKDNDVVRVREIELRFVD
jgi:GTP-binding protein